MARGQGRVADSLAVPWLDQLAAATTYLSLSTGDPFSVSDPKTLEPGGPVYARAPVTWTRSGRLLYNAVALAWTGVPANSVVAYIVGWDAAFNGNVTFGTPITPLTYGQSQAGGLIIDIGQFFVGLDA